MGVEEAEKLGKALKKCFDIDTYLQLRRLTPDTDPYLWVFFGHVTTVMDYAIHIEKECEKHNITIQNFLGAMDGDLALTDNLCLECLAAISHREKLKADKNNAHLVANGLVISDSLINLFISAVLEALAYYETSPPHSFDILVNYHLGRLGKKVPYQEAIGVREKKNHAAFFIDANPELSLRQAAAYLHINVSQLSRWQKDDKFMAVVKLHRKFAKAGEKNPYKLENIEVLQTK